MSTNIHLQLQWWPVQNAIYFANQFIEGILPKGLYPPCSRMADRALLAGYHRYVGHIHIQMLVIIDYDNLGLIGCNTAFQASYNETCYLICDYCLRQLRNLLLQCLWNGDKFKPPQSLWQESFMKHSAAQSPPCIQPPHLNTSSCQHYLGSLYVKK